MRQPLLLLLISFLLEPLCALPANETPQEMSLNQLEQRRDAIDVELANLASYSLRSGVGSNGYRSDPHKTAVAPEWVEVDLGREVSIDELVLVPTLLRDTKEGFQAEGFPVVFRILAGTSPDTNGTVIASFTEQDGLLPRIAPLVVPCRKTSASWVRIEADRLSARGIDGRFILQLSELLVFSGSTNVANRCPVTGSIPYQPPISAWGERFLTDGTTPYLMDAATGGKGIAFLNSVGIIDQPVLTIDLQEVYPLSQINLHAIDQSDTVPPAFYGDFGIPKHFIMEGATQPDFSDVVLLLDATCETIYDMAPIMSWNIPETRCRYVRLTALDPYIFNDGKNIGTRIGFAEIELLGDGRNWALSKPVTSNFEIQSPDRPLSTLTDGLNFYGHILPLREWMEQLARRHDLENERPVIAEELTKRYARQKTNLNRLMWLTALLGAGIAFTLLIDRIVRLRQVTRIKERLAADLHDELGANIHSIGMLSDLAQDADTPNEWKSIHQRIWGLTQRTATAIRYCTNMMDANGLYIGLVEDMQRAAKRISDTITHEFSVEGEPWLDRLKPRTRVDLFLFYKECLINICRHSGATNVCTHLTAAPREVLLTVTDNGKGTEKIPASLQRRARLLKAKLTLERPPEGGTCITLRLRSRGKR
jgi:signal transduction histidine kinase